LPEHSKLSPKSKKYARGTPQLAAQQTAQTAQAAMVVSNAYVGSLKNSDSDMIASLKCIGHLRICADDALVLG
jgi:hypothetical protein